MRFVEVVLNEPDKMVVALADAYFFPPYQPTLYRPKAKGGVKLNLKLPPRQARLVVYNKRTNETSIWIVELSEVHAVARGGHTRGKVLSSEVVPDVQPPMVCGLKTTEKVWLNLRGNNGLDQLRRLQQWDCSLVSMEHIRQSYFLCFLVTKNAVDCAHGVY
jgi:hypothetical protein